MSRITWMKIIHKSLYLFTKLEVKMFSFLSFSWSQEYNKLWGHLITFTFFSKMLLIAFFCFTLWETRNILEYLFFFNLLSFCFSGWNLPVAGAKKTYGNSTDCARKHKFKNRIPYRHIITIWKHEFENMSPQSISKLSHQKVVIWEKSFFLRLRKSKGKKLRKIQ